MVFKITVSNVGVELYATYPDHGLLLKIDSNTPLSYSNTSVSWIGVKLKPEKSVQPCGR